MPTKQIKELAVNSGLTDKEYWTEVIRESQESNLSKKEFCKQRGIPISAYLLLGKWAKSKNPKLVPHGISFNKPNSSFLRMQESHIERRFRHSTTFQPE